MILDYISNSASLPFTQQVFQGFTSELQWSSHYQVSFVLHGSLSIHYKNHTREFAQNYICFFAPFETFSYVSATTDTRVLTLVIDSGFINQLCPEAPHILFQKNHISYDSRDPVYQTICHELATIIFNNLKNDTCFQMRLLTSITNIMISLIENFGVKPEQLPENDYSTQRIVQILEYIRENYQNRLTVTDIASHLSLHPQYFSAFFNKQFQTSFPEYLTSFRINQSIRSLMYSQESILDIALSHGFSNHKTYAAAFRKYYHCSPTEYRKGTRNQLPPGITSDSGSSSHFDLFAFFRQYMKEDSTVVNPGNLRNQKTLEFNPAELAPRSLHRNQDTFATIGRAYACLRSEVQQQILKAKKDFNFTYLRFRDIFSDDLYVYSENDNREPLFSWHTLDNVFDFLLEHNIRPFPEIGYMPERLASKKQYSGWQYHPNVSFPKSMEKWKLLVRNFLQHYINRYGIEELKTWYFDFWTAPDLNIKAAFWNESMDMFFQFYHETYLVFQETDPRLRLGSPNFSTLSGFPWYEKFFQYCYLHHIFPNYISIHIYGCEPSSSSGSSLTFDEMNIESYSISNQNLVHDYLLSLKQIMHRNGFRDLDIIVADWNLNFIPKDLIRDTCYMGPYISHTMIQTMMLVKGICYWSLSDIHEDFFPESTLFSGGPGMLDVHGLPKASYNAMLLLMKLGDRILELTDFYVLVQKGTQYQLFVYNLPHFDYLYSLIDKSAIDSYHRYSIYRNTEEILLNIVIHLPKGEYYIKKYEVNRTYGSVYDLWSQMGFPASLSKDEENYLRESSIPHLTMQLSPVDTVMILDERVPAHGIMLLEIIPK